jgi:hypothetical protein
VRSVKAKEGFEFGRESSAHYDRSGWGCVNYAAFKLYPLAGMYGNTDNWGNPIFLIIFWQKSKTVKNLFASTYEFSLNFSKHFEKHLLNCALEQYRTVKKL